MNRTIDVNGTLVPDLPFIWYRDEQLTAPFEYCELIENNELIDIL
jgi:hypothetical protein